jgi:hypothetical protein
MRPRIFVTQPVSRSAIERLRRVASVKVNPDASRIIPKKALLTAVRNSDIVFSLLHDRIDRDVLAANPKLAAVASQSITPDNIDVAEATRRKIPVTVVPPIVAEATADLHLRADAGGGAADGRGRSACPPWPFPWRAVEPSRRGGGYGKTIGWSAAADASAPAWPVAPAALVCASSIGRRAASPRPSSRISA